MNKRYSFAAGAVVAGAGMAALLLGLPGVNAQGGIVAVKGTDYAFGGVPGTLKAGETRFSFTNESKAEGHELSIFRINDGVSQSLDQILAEDEARQQQAEAPQQGGGQSGGQQGGQNPPPNQTPPPPKMTFFGGTGAGPGESAKMDLIGNLPAGRYGLVCFIPSNDEAGTPHYKKGMKAEISVQ
ncbi:MAG: hypothetical protein AB1679_15065 [Actinomycetota bacterium]|jgi:uncharacterized cupredoxin-like copper-binding protein